MTLAIRFAPEAAEQAQLVSDWWAEAHPSMPLLFVDELAAAVRVLRRLPDAGGPHEHPKRSGIRRMLLRRSQHYVYYRLDADSLVVLAVWSTARGRPPPLSA